MTDPIADLKISLPEVERLSGLEVSDTFIGGPVGGTYRPSLCKHPRRLLSFCLTELFILILIGIFSLPIGLLLTRNAAATSSQSISQFLTITLGLSLVLVAGWHLQLWLKRTSLATLNRLVDEVDHHNEVIQALQVVEQLEAVGHLPVNLSNRDQVLAALSTTRESLVCALMTEKILRENKALMARRHDLFISIENNLVTLRTLEVNAQASEYGQFLNQALQIGLSVYQEVKNLQE